MATMKRGSKKTATKMPMKKSPAAPMIPSPASPKPLKKTPASGFVPPSVVPPKKP